MGTPSSQSKIERIVTSFVYGWEPRDNPRRDELFEHHRISKNRTAPRIRYTPRILATSCRQTVYA